jgi:hypothetical protein
MAGAWLEWQSTSLQAQALSSNPNTAKKKNLFRNGKLFTYSENCLNISFHFICFMCVCKILDASELLFTNFLISVYGER